MKFSQFILKKVKIMTRSDGTIFSYKIWTRSGNNENPSRVEFERLVSLDLTLLTRIRSIQANNTHTVTEKQKRRQRVNKRRDVFPP